jgi:hypothetical protein
MENKKEAKTASLRLPGWGGCCIPNPVGGNQQRLPCQAGLHLTRGSRLPSRKRLTTRGLVFADFLTSGTVGVNQKRTILWNYLFDTGDLMESMSFPESPGSCLPGALGRRAFAVSKIEIEKT